MMKFPTYTWDLVRALESASPDSCKTPATFIYINDLSVDLTTNVKLSTDETSLFSIVHNMNMSTTNLNNDLNKIKNWAI